MEQSLEVRVLSDPQIVVLERIDSDEDLDKIVRRVHSQLGYRPVFMPYIPADPDLYSRRTFNFRSIIIGP